MKGKVEEEIQGGIRNTEDPLIKLYENLLLQKLPKTQHTCIIDRSNIIITVVALSYPPGLEGKTLLLKKPHT